MTAEQVTALPDGLVLREGRPSDLDQVGALLVERGEPVDAPDHRLVVEDPDLGWGACAVVADGDRIVSTATLLDETVRIGDVVLPAGQVELVATDTEYEGRGLVRALMGWAHERSLARGQVLGVMIGIPYFYRLFGYEYAINIPRVHALTGPPGTGGDGFSLRPAGPDDIAAIGDLQDAVQADFDVAMPHPDPRRRWLIEHDATTTCVLERGGTIVATARTRADDDELLLAEPAARDNEAAVALLRAVTAEHPSAEVQVVHRPGTVTGRAWQDLLGPANELSEEYYVRIPDPAVLLDRLRPLFAQRLTAAGVDRAGKDIVVSTYGRHYRMAVTDEGVGPVRAGGPLQGPGSEGGCGVAPDRLPALLFGPLGMHGMCRRFADVYPGPDQELFTTLFPPLTADLLTYYLPF